MNNKMFRSVMKEMLSFMGFMLIWFGVIICIVATGMPIVDFLENWAIGG